MHLAIYAGFLVLFLGTVTLEIDHLAPESLKFLEGAVYQWYSAILDLFAFFNIPHINQMYMLYRARLLDLDFSPGAESLEVALYSEQDIPWDQVAFPAIERTLTYYFDDVKRGTFSVHTGVIDRRPGK